MKKLYLLLCILILSLACGCKSEVSNINDVTDISTLTEPAVNVNFSDTTYNFETDCQNYINYDCKNIAVGPDGYYIIELLPTAAFQKISYIDKNTGDCRPLCSRADCTHEIDSDCDAYVSDSLRYLTYYEGNLYAVSTTIDESTATATTILHRISADGSQKNDVCELYTESIAMVDMFWSACIPNYVIHRGYVYFVFSDGNGSYLYQKNIETSDSPQLICKNESNYTAIGHIMGYGDGVIFDALYGTADKYSYKVLYYNEPSDETFLLINGVNGYYTVADNYIIYQNSELTGTTKYSLKDYTSEIFTEEYIGQISYDGNYVYVDNYLYCKEDKSDRTVNVYDIDGNLIDTIDMPGEEYLLEFGDEYYLFKSSSKDNNIYMLDKNQIGIGSHEWIKIE